MLSGLPRRYLGVAQFGSVLEWGSRGRRFESSHPDLRKPDQNQASYFSFGAPFNNSEMPLNHCIVLDNIKSVSLRAGTFDCAFRTFWGNHRVRFNNCGTEHFLTVRWYHTRCCRHWRGKHKESQRMYQKNNIKR